MPQTKEKIRFVISLALCVVFVCVVAALLLPAITSQATMYLDKVDEIPDIKQTDKRLHFPDNGKDFCAPVVVIDSFVQLKKHGYNRIFGDQAGSAEIPLDACSKLAKLMNTRTGPGTTTEDFLAGLKHYVEQFTPYKIKSLKYEGWNRHPAKFDNGQAAASLDWIKHGIRDNNCAWLNIGWYTINAESHEMKREAGHWVCLVGYGIGIDGVSDPNTLVVRDPDPVLSEESRKIFITVAPLETGYLTGPHYGLPRNAKGYLGIKAMGNGLDTTRHRTGIIDGAIVLELWPAWATW